MCYVVLGALEWRARRVNCPRCQVLNELEFFGLVPHGYNDYLVEAKRGEELTSSGEVPSGGG